uniref:Uncharacterized protein n=1 Tax=Setaria italica TaxID=4555 RepID=K3ZG77_SETIT
MYGDRPSAGGGEEPRDRWPVYIPSSYLVRLGLGFLASSTARQRLVYPGGFDFRLPVILSL